jgi:hypothetical protein
MQHFDHNIGFWEKRKFFHRKLRKIAQNCDHNIDPWAQDLLSSERKKFPRNVGSRVARWFIFKPKIPLWVIWRAFDLKMLYILWPFWIFYRHLVYIFYYHFVHFVFILYMFSGFGIMHLEKSGNPGRPWKPICCNCHQIVNNSFPMRFRYQAGRCRIF